MTPEEIKCFETTGKLVGEFMNLPIVHNSDQGDFLFHIHAIQNILLSRVGLRKIRENEQAKDKETLLITY